MSHLQGPHPRAGSPHPQLPIRVMIRRLRLSADQFFDHRATSLRPMQDKAMLNNARNPNRRQE
ncbi:hypothetical protein K469DRAFT_713854 [Zopfia rhizophila CBS 207.26]|uniref:Uncharacterized protein n=1 Tax=Zopfia rhizophila CBS 207.26 TaxID=1314779 RepID=A0A6A6DPK3_9PEZI|nr:hypothetical protein K469DRAFT_713854 [Zopfia rhizophila CBS 207.26]